MSRRGERRRKRARKGVWIAVGTVTAVLVIGIGAAAATGVLAPFGPDSTAPSSNPSASPSLSPPPPPPPPPTEPPPPPPPPTPVSPATTSCEGAVTTVIVAHYDDDLLFANPAVIEALRRGDCVNTVFLTAGDAGRGLQYAMSREVGIYRAYNIMRAAPGTTWTPREQVLLSGVHVTQVSPDDNPRLTVTLLRLPDGNLDATGFTSTGNESLAKLLRGDIPQMHQIDTRAALTLPTLVATLQELIVAFDTDTLITLVPAESGWAAGDHSDHSTAGSVVRAAWQGIGFDPAGVRYAVGYHTTQMPENVFSPDLDLKIDSFMVYAQQDPVSHCDTRATCLKLRLFGASLKRQYLLTEAEAFP